jgi:hypothetical protein
MTAQWRGAGRALRTQLGSPGAGKLVAGSKAAFSILIVCFGATAMSLEGQQATLTDASRVFELNVWNRDAVQALPGQHRSVTMTKCSPEAAARGRR